MAWSFDFKTVSDEDWGDFMGAVYRENQDREVRANTKARIEALVKQYAEIVSGDEPKKIEFMDPSASIGPGEHVIESGVEYENVSGAWLPVSAPPSKYPLGWKRAGADVVDEDDVKGWEPGVTYKPGDMVSYQGKAWKCLLGHPSAVGWEPGVAPSLWAEA